MKQLVVRQKISISNMALLALAFAISWAMMHISGLMSNPIAATITMVTGGCIMSVVGYKVWQATSMRFDLIDYLLTSLGAAFVTSILWLFDTIVHGQQAESPTWYISVCVGGVIFRYVLRWLFDCFRLPTQ